MKTCLISPPTVTDFEDPSVAESDAIRLIAEHAPMGILSLAAVLDQTGCPPDLVDLNRLYYEYLRYSKHRQSPKDFCTFAAENLQDKSYDVWGLSTICSSYPLTLRLAKAIRQSHPDTTIVLGGPQASVVDAQTLQSFPFIDFVVRGEAEETLPLLLDAVAGGQAVEAIPGITFRRGGNVTRNPNAPVIKDLDKLPVPAFHLYPHLKDCRYVPLELGRGCPFACEFCSTNDFFRRRFRLKSPERVIDEMRFIRNAYGITTFDLIHDMFTVDRKRVVAFCNALLESGEQFHWNCSARTDCIDDELIALMAQAGCKGIFFGIESGSERMQKLINKGLDLDEAAQRIRCTDEHGIRTAVSLIAGFAEETMEDLSASISFLVDSLRYDHAEPQLHLLAPLAETPIHYKHRNELILDDIYSDMSYQGWRQDPVDREMIEAHREIFPNFYAVPTPHLDRRYLKECREFILNGIHRFRWLLVALHQESGHLLKVFDQWRAWRIQRQGDGLRAAATLSIYYSQGEFVKDFLDFLQSSYPRESAGQSSCSLALVDFETAFGSSQVNTTSSNGAVGKRSQNTQALRLDESLRPDTIPCLAEGNRIARLGIDYMALIECLRAKGRLAEVPRKPLTVVMRQIAEKDVQFVQLSRLSARLLDLCNGSRTVAQVADLFGSLGEDLDGIAPSKACIFGLELLRQQGVVVALCQR